MSIRDEINYRIDEGRLFRLEPRIVGDAKERTVLMSMEINLMVNGPWSDGPMGNRCAILRAELENFVSGEPITVCWNPFRANDTHQMGRLDKVEDEIWDYRSVHPSPGLRIFCRFAEKDVLVALTCSPRSVQVSWLSRLPLLRGSSSEWKIAKRECRAEWAKLFPAYSPMTGENVNDYITNAVL